MKPTAHSRRGSSTAPAVPVLGKLGASQVVSTFGVGSIYEMRSPAGNGSLIVHSVMLSGLEFWPSDNAGFLYESSLQRALGVRYFRSPPPDKGKREQNQKFLPAVRFPGLFYCSVSSCGRVGTIGTEFLDRSASGAVCARPGCRGKGIPFRFITACHLEGDPAHRGHVDDFPYRWWAHSRGKTCSNPVIHLRSSEEKSGLEGMYLHCQACGEGRSLAGVFSADAVSSIKCRGRRPWLGDKEEGCDRELRVLQRGASNVYFPVTVSAISIPPHSGRLRQLLEDAIPPAFLLTLQGNGGSSLEGLLGAARNSPGLDDRDRYSDEQVRSAIMALAGMGVSDSAVQSLAEQKRLEQNAIIAGCTEPEDEFQAEQVDLTGNWASVYVGHLSQVHRLREVRAIRGFQRVEPGYGGDPYRIECAPLSRKRMDWLPAVEVRGEGIYLGLCPDAVGRWQELAAVQRRVAVLNGNYRDACASTGREVEREYSARFILAHTLSHLLMKQLSLECGYSGSSLRERLYVDDEDQSRTGLMIYTASSSADGTLGGLVSQGAADVFPGILEAAVQSARWCSSDPLCEESDGQGNNAMNLAACHACALVAETSCEERNMLLDRAMVVGTTSTPAIGYFHHMIAKWDCG